MKKNSNNTLLTVLGCATLLVALVGATFAYFSATSNTESQNVTTGVLKISAVAGSVVEAGIKPVKSDEIGTIDEKLSNSNVVKLPITVNTTGSNITSTYDIHLTTASVLDGKGLNDTISTTNGNSSHIKWELVKLDSENATTGISIGSGDFTSGNKVDEKLNSNSIDLVAGTDYYKILIYILDSDTVQDDLQGMTITATTNVKAKQK